MAKIYYDQDADLALIKGRKIAVLGFGSQGHAQAQNLQDSGMDVVVGLRRDSASWNKAEAAGLRVMPVVEACAYADIIQILLPDEVQGEVYEKEVKENLTEGKALMFSHGFNIHFSQIQPPNNVDVFMVAPKSPGHLLRWLYEEGKGVPALVAVHQDYSGKAKDIALAYAKAIGCTRAGVFETSFREETESDLFGEQVALCGGLAMLIKASFETLVEAGYAPEIAYFECLHEMKLIIDLIYEGGLEFMRYSVSNTCEYGDYTRGPRIITDATRAEMKKILSEIQSGQFAKEWMLENQAKRPSFNAMRNREKQHQIEIVGRQLREMMPFIKRGRQ